MRWMQISNVTQTQYWTLNIPPHFDITVHLKEQNELNQTSVAYFQYLTV